jgi:hypothetical protein
MSSWLKIHQGRASMDNENRAPYRVERPLFAIDLPPSAKRRLSAPLFSALFLRQIAHGDEHALLNILVAQGVVLRVHRSLFLALCPVLILPLPTAFFPLVRFVACGYPTATRNVKYPLDKL